MHVAGRRLSVFQLCLLHPDLPVLKGSPDYWKSGGFLSEGKQKSEGDLSHLFSNTISPAAADL